MKLIEDWELARGKDANMTDMTAEERAAFREKAAASMDRSAVAQKAAMAHMQFTKIAALIQVGLLAAIAAGVWLR